MTDKLGKSVLFLLGRFTVGGGERVTVLLANALVERGWSVCVAAFAIEERDVLERLDSRIAVREIGMPAYRLQSVIALRKIMREFKVSHVVNQWAFPFPVTVMLRMAMPHGARLVCVFHTMPNRSRRISESAGLKRRLMTWVVRQNSRLVYRFCDAYVVLAKSYEQVFRDFTGLTTTPKLVSIPNPMVRTDVAQTQKENMILYVGRLTRTEKRVDRVVDVWRRLAGRLPDWTLEIVGDGPDREELEKSAVGLSRISFKGFQRPDNYYARAKILLLTSDFEGFPMTLVEAMAYACVPVVYGSFHTAREIVGYTDGIVFSPPWDVNGFADRIEELVNNPNLLDRMAKAGLHHVDCYDIEKVLSEYLKVLENE